jgi:hypothetical protein
MSTKTLWLALALLGCGAVTAACEEKSLAEEAADAVDDAAHDAADAVKDATDGK